MATILFQHIDAHCVVLMAADCLQRDIPEEWWFPGTEKATSQPEYTWNLGSSVDVFTLPDNGTPIARDSGCGLTRVMINVLASSTVLSSFTFQPIG